MPEIGLHAPARMLVAVRAEYSRSDVRDALRHDLHIVAVLASCHAIGHFGGQQALDRPKKRERERSRQHVKYG